MKLIQENNTLYIVEGENKYKVEEDSANELMVLYLKVTVFDNIEYKRKTADRLRQGIDITDIKHRIEIRSVRQIREDNGTYVGTETHAFLLPEKEDKCDGTCAPKECICEEVKRQELKEFGEKMFLENNRLYSIGDIEKAIEKTYITIQSPIFIERIKKAIIKNLKNSKI